MVFAALLLATAITGPVAAQTASPPPQPVPTPPASGGYLGAEHHTAELATWAFAFGCLGRLDDPKAEFAKRSDMLGAELAHDHPEDAAAVTLDGDEGQGCRVRYTGGDAPTMWRAWRSVPAIFAPRAGPGCVPVESAETHIRARCEDAGSRRWEITIERTSSGQDATVAAILRLTP